MSGDIYKNKTRIRVNGLLFDNDAILLAQIKSPVSNELVWMPPGGGLRFGEEIGACLRREFREETGLEVSMDSLVAINELVKPPFHALEMYFKVQQTSGTLALGNDPEHPDDKQVLKDLRWVPVAELGNLSTAPDKLPRWVRALLSKQQAGRVFFQTN